MQRNDLVETASQIFGFLLLGWLAALAFIVVGRALFGTGQHTGILTTLHADSGRGPVNPERVQLLAIFLGAAAMYAFAGIQAGTEGTVSSLPEASEALTIALTGSNALYLSGKIVRT